MFLQYLIAYIIPLCFVALGVFIIIISKLSGDKFIKRCSTELKGECSSLKQTPIPGLVKPEYTTNLDGQQIVLKNKTFIIQGIAKRNVGDKVTLHVDRAAMNDFYIDGKKPLFKLIGIIGGCLIIVIGALWLAMNIMSTMVVL